MFGDASRITVALLCLCVASPRASRAFVFPLQEIDVRDAYFLGRTTDSEKLIHFFDGYTCHFRIPEKGPDVDEIQFHTPYELVVEKAWDRWTSYTEQDAQQDYSARPDRVLVSIRIYRTLTYPSLSIHPASSLGPSEVSWAGFHFRVVQGHTIQARNFSTNLLHHRSTGLGGAELILEFRASEFVPGTATVEVTTPDGQHVEAKFDLSKLK